MRRQQKKIPIIKAVFIVVWRNAPSILPPLAYNQDSQHSSHESPISEARHLAQRLAREKEEYLAPDPRDDEHGEEHERRLALMELDMTDVKGEDDEKERQDSWDDEGEGEEAV